MLISSKTFTRALLIAIITCAASLDLSAFAENAQNEKPVAAPSVFGAKMFTLANGLTGIVVENNRAPVVTHMLWIKAGAADEPESTGGVAHYLEHLMFKGTPTVGPGEYSRKIRNLGGNDNAFTAQDYTAYFVTIAPEHLAAVMALESDRFAHLSPPKDHIASEHQVILEERRQRTENDPLGPFYEQINATLYASHAYANPVIGWMSDMERLSWQDAKSFKDTWYAPNNMVLVVSGDVTVAQVKKLAEKYYGGWQRRTLPPRQRLQPPPQPAATTLSFNSDPRLRQPQLSLVWRVPSFHQDKEKSLALQVLEETLSGGASTWLYRDLVVEKKKAVDISLSYTDDSWDDSSLWITATPADSVSLNDLRTAILESLDRAGENLTAMDILGASLRLQQQAIFARDSVAGPAMIIGQALTTGSTLEDIETWPEQIAAVKASTVRGLIKTLLRCTPAPTCQPPLTGLVDLAPGVSRSSSPSPLHPPEEIRP